MTIPMPAASIHSHAHPKFTKGGEADSVLDALQLIQLEWSFRQWVRLTSDYEARLARHRGLIVFLLLRYADASLEQVLALKLGADLVGRRIFLRECDDEERSVREVVVTAPIADEIRMALDSPDLGQLLSALDELSATWVQRSIAERAEACGFPSELCTPEMIRAAAARASVVKQSAASCWHPVGR